MVVLSATPREVLLAAFREEETSLHVIIPTLAADAALAALSAAGFEVVPSALVDAVLDGPWVFTASAFDLGDALRALRAYRETT